MFHSVQKIKEYSAEEKKKTQINFADSVLFGLFSLFFFLMDSKSVTC